MYKTQLKDGNVVISELPFELIKNNIQFHGATNSTIFLAPKAGLEKGTIHVYGDNAAVFIGNTNLRGATIYAYEQCCIYIGNRVYMNASGETQTICAAEKANIIIGNHCLCSSSVVLTTTDVHLIYDKSTRKRVNESKSLFIGDHVWLGREVKVFKKACIASGCMCAARSVVSAGVYPVNSLVAGLPARVKKEGNIFWLSPSVYEFSEADRKHYAALDENDEEYRNACFEPAQEETLRPADLDATLHALSDSQDKIAFLYDKLWCNEAQNRFAWDAGSPTANGRILAYGDSLSKLTLTLNQHKGSAAPSCEDAGGHLTPEDIAALLYAGAARWKLFCYGVLSLCSFGAKRRHYRHKKREMRMQLERAAKLRNAVRKKLGL